MGAVTRTTGFSDKNLDRALRGALVGLVVLALALAGFYYSDRHVTKAPSLLDKQVASAEQSVRKAPGNVGARLLLAQAYQADKRFDDALGQYEQVLKANPKHRLALMGRARVLLEKKQLDKAIKAFRLLVDGARRGEFARADPLLQEAYYYLGDIALRQHKPLVAVTDLQAALKIEPTDSDALYLLGVADVQLGKTKEAVAVLKRALLFVPYDWCEPYEELVKAYTKLSQPAQAEYAGGMSDLCRKRFDSAGKRLTALVSGPEGIDAMLGLGLLSETRGENPTAITWYRKVLARDAKNIRALSALARLGVTPPGAAAHTSSRQGAK